MATINISYPYGDFANDDHVKEVCFNGSFYGSGAGFGRRDIDYDFPHEGNGQALAARIEAELKRRWPAVDWEASPA